MTTFPITPDEVAFQQTADFPEEVLKTWNALIASNFVNGESVVTVTNVALAMKRFIPEVADFKLLPAEIQKRGWLNIWGLYRLSGWCVRFEAAAELADAKFYFCPIA